MAPITGTYRPLGLDTIEKETIFNLETLMSGLYSKTATTSYPHSYVESDAVYGAPIVSKRIIPTPTNGLRLIYVIAFQLNPMAGFQANGIWNHVLPMAQDLVL